MLQFAYPSLESGEQGSYVVGPPSAEPDGGYIWHHWLPALAVLDPSNLRLRRLEEVLAAQTPFVYPLELRWEFLAWFATGQAQAFVTPHIPAGVFAAARRGQAVILLSIAHEGRLLGYARKGIGDRLSAYDLIHGFVAENNLPQHSVWFANGNLGGRAEYEAWKRSRFGSDAIEDPFRVRYVELFSYLAQSAQRMRADGFDLALNYVADQRGRGGGLVNKQTNLRLIPNDPGTAESLVGETSGQLPPKLFLSMNRKPRGHRRIIACHLLRRGLLDRSLVSLVDEHPEATVFDDPDVEAAWQALQKRLPLTIDRDLPLDFASYARDNFAAVKLGDLWPYRETSFSIVTETGFRSDVAFVSEKIWKPIQVGHPFLLVGTPGTLAWLRSLGFRTFAPAIDETYDTIVDNEARLAELLKVIDRLGALSDGNRANLLRELRPVLSHNAEHFRHFVPPMRRILLEIETTLFGQS